MQATHQRKDRLTKCAGLGELALITRCNFIIGSIFFGSTLDIKTLAAMTLAFVNDMKINCATKSLGLGRATLIKWYAMLRRLIRKYVEHNQLPIGGDGFIVEADEVCLGHVDKQLPHEQKRAKQYHVLHGEWWGALERGRRNVVLMEIPTKPRRGCASSLQVMPLISKFIKHYRYAWYCTCSYS